MCILLTDFLIYTEVFLYIMYNSICFFYEYDEIWYQQSDMPSCIISCLKNRDIWTRYCSLVCLGMI